MYPNLKLQIWKSGIRQNRLAQMLGMDETMLSKIVNGFREPSQDLRGRIASLLQSQEDWLFERTSPREAPPSAPAVKAARRS
jgi:transcriptional regulator with XRE-family HTH domain